MGSYVIVVCAEMGARTEMANLNDNELLFHCKWNVDEAAFLWQHVLVVGVDMHGIYKVQVHKGRPGRSGLPSGT